MVKLSYYFYKNLWCTFTQMLNENKFLIFKVIKSLVANEYTAQQTYEAKKKGYYKKAY